MRAAWPHSRGHQSYFARHRFVNRHGGGGTARILLIDFICVARLNVAKQHVGAG
jgi:hypothetical protein